MTGAVAAPCGSWSSPISSQVLAGDRADLDEPRIVDGHVYWLEGRGSEGGRVVLVRDGVDLTPAPFNVRTRVHEYGGGAYVVHGDLVVFSNFADLRLYRLDLSNLDAGPRPITPGAESGVRFADLRVDAARGSLLAVREDHRGAAEVVNTIVRLDLDGPNDGTGTVLVAGPDFVAAPRLSPDGARLAWLQWDHPNMPWDSTQLWVAELDGNGVLTERVCVAGGDGVAVTEPVWAPDGRLLFLSDQTGWANLYAALPGSSEPVAVAPAEAEFGWPQWVLDRPSYGVATDGTIVCTWLEHGLGHLGTVSPDGRRATLALDGTAYDEVRVEGTTVVGLADFADRPGAVFRTDLATGGTTVLRTELGHEVPPGLVGRPEPVSWTNGTGQEVHGIFHPPANDAFAVPDGERPPLVVRVHGGPTSMTRVFFSLDTAYWTSRGLAVLDVNYGGSTGYGRRYRERLKGMWGLTDVDDTVTGALAMADTGRVDRTRLAIRGGSAGGFTTLAVLTGSDAFAAGASHFGVGDLEGLARDTHKFESRYLDGLVAPYPQGRDVYLERSPVHHVDSLSAPMILLQGLDDKVVPPAQAREMAAAVRAKGFPVALLEFEGEGHGFRSAVAMVRSRDAEAYFYSKVFGFELADADQLEPVEIANL
jgi:dipeptidyl aminopeptidase/acylaminoacyl peptidase